MDSRQTLFRKLAPVALAVVLSAGAAGTAVAAQPPNPDAPAFGIVSINPDQTIRLNVVCWDARGR